MKAKLNLTLSAVAMALALSACGGGGTDGTNAPTPTTENPGDNNPTNPQLSQPQLTVAPADYSDQIKLDAFNEINKIRGLAGLGLLAQNSKLDQAAQAHADWQVFNNVMSHFETAGTIGFTGVTVGDRIRATGYSPATGGEVIAYLLQGDTGAYAATSLNNLIYHRIFLLDPTIVDVGIGANLTGEPMPVNIKVGIPSTASGQGIPNNNNAVVWPIDGAINVKIAMGPEDPNPIPDVSVYSVGYPVSIHCAKGQTLNVTSFKIREQGGTDVDAVLRHWTADPNNIFQQMKCAAGLVPRTHLKHNTNYEVDFVGSIDGTAMQKTWRFSTTAN